VTAQDGTGRRNFWQKLQAIDRRWIYLVVWLVVMLPLIFPFYIKPRPTPPTEKLFQFIDTMPQDKALAVSIDYGPDTQAELQPMLVALLRHAFATHHRVGMLAMVITGLGLGEDALRQVTAEFNAHATTHDDSVINGEDYAFWGWSTPPVTVILGMGENIAKVFPVDYYGAKTESLPIMKHLKNYGDIGILVSIAASAFPLSWINLAQTQFGVRLGCGITAVSAADFYPYLNSGQFSGMLGGMKGAAEYEQLVEERMAQNGQVWHLRMKGTEAMSSQSAAHLAIIAFIIIGNIAFFATRRRKS